MSGLKVVALISGGKDSFFSILHCLANGHEVVALANLYPPVENGEQSEDLDSFMYQTVGHSVIPLYEKALGLPLYRQEILGSAVDSNKSYATPSGNGQATGSSSDETESLLPLLNKVMKAHPEINAISTGAILSDYQRTRVESIAIRLGLVPLSYLWQYMFLPPYSETSLLDDMAAVGQDARIIKVASGGLDDSFLWENVAHTRTKTRLVKAMQRFGTLGDGAAVGEGGEFETLAIDGPWPIWKSSILVDEADQMVSMGDAGVASLKLRNARLVEKSVENDAATIALVLGQLRKPPMLDDIFDDIRSRLVLSQTASGNNGRSAEPTCLASPIALTATWTSRRAGNLVVLANCVGEGTSAGNQMRNIMTLLLENHKLEPSSIAFTTILLRDMRDFGNVNAAYGAAFTAPSPPARVTIACGNTLPAGVDVSLSIVALDAAAQGAKQGLHVQSRSYWAPANIGPYSQAISVPRLSLDQDRIAPSTVFVAGQIPLVPNSMNFLQKGESSSEAHFADQAVLSLQHLWRIGQIMKVKLWLGAVAFIPRSSDVTAESRVNIAMQAWRLAHETPNEDESDEDDDTIDVWDRMHGRHQTHSGTGLLTGTSTKRPAIKCSTIPPCFVAEVEDLPRSAPIEWASIGSNDLASAYKTSEDRSTISDIQTIEIARANNEAKLASWISIRDLAAIDDLINSDAWNRVASVQDSACTIYTTQTLPSDLDNRLSPQIIPCHRIWDAIGDTVSAVIAFRMS